MNSFMAGFADELVKVSAKQDFDAEMKKALRSARRKSESSSLSKIRGQGRPVSRDYLAATMLGAAASPLVYLSRKGISRGLHNRAIRKAIKQTSSPKAIRQLKSELQRGPMTGSGIPKPKPGLEPLVTHSELLGGAATGGFTGSALQMLRDRFAGSAGARDRKQ